MNKMFHVWWHDQGRCSHRSHRWRLLCLREWVYQYQCQKHNGTCFGGKCR